MEATIGMPYRLGKQELFSSDVLSTTVAWDISFVLNRSSSLKKQHKSQVGALINPRRLYTCSYASLFVHVCSGLCVNLYLGDRAYDSVPELPLE
jgi:hypothetical protein